MRGFDAVKAWAQGIKRDAVTLWFAVKHPATPWYARALGLLVVAYALSPIDLIPDFIPVLGYVDDVLLLPGLIWLALWLMPADILASCREQAHRWLEVHRVRPRSVAGALLVVLAWMGLGLLLAVWLLRPTA